MSTPFSTTSDHQLLLDTIDRLRSYGLSKYVDIPEIIVCGEQSSGKSATMEALSLFGFPTKDNLCTRFATEVVLRRSPVGSTKISVIPGSDSSQEQREKLKNFEVSESLVEQDFGSIIEKAKAVMGISDGQVFSTDILRIEISGPSQPHLTLVDLPGIFRAGNRDQSIQDSHMVRKLVRGYMERPRSIILAVVSAKSDFNLQEVTELARELDPNGQRTIGLITKPDTLDSGSDSELAYAKLARNQDVEFRLGWHVIMNRSYETRNTTLQDRHSAEANFFSTGIWTTIDSKALGIDNLRHRLSIVLRDQIILELPGLLSDLRRGIQDSNNRLRRLGDPRTTISEQRRYLLRTSQQFTTMVSASVSGIYSDEYFGDPLTANGQERRLRAVVQNMLTDFEYRIRRSGHQVEILDDEHNLGDLESGQISRQSYLEKVRTILRNSRGCELPGTFNPLIISHLFKEHCKPWKSMVLELQHDILAAVYKTIDSIIEHVAAEDTVQGLKQIINKNLAILKGNLEAKTDELLRPCYEIHPITYNHYLTEQVQSIQAARRKAVLERTLKDAFGVGSLGSAVTINNCINFRSILDKLDVDHEADMERNAASMAVDYMQAYYKVALKRFVDNVGIYAIECCLLDKLSGVFTPEMTNDIPDHDVRSITGERAETSSQRQKLTQQLQILERSLHELDYLDRSRTRINSIPQASKPAQREGSSTDAPKMSSAVVPSAEDTTVESPCEETPVCNPDNNDDLWGHLGSKKKDKKKTMKKSLDAIWFNSGEVPSD